MHGLFTCSNYPNVEARASAILVGTSKQLLLQPYVRLHMVMSATVQPKCRTYTHFRDLDNYQIEGLYFLYGRCSKGAGRTHNVIDLKFYLLLNLSVPTPLTPPLQSVYRYRGDTFLWDGFKMFQYFQAVRLQQDKEVARWLIFSVSQAARAVSEK